MCPFFAIAYLHVRLSNLKSTYVESKFYPISRVYIKVTMYHCYKIILMYLYFLSTVYLVC